MTWWKRLIWGSCAFLALGLYVLPMLFQQVAISVWENLSKRRREANCPRPLWHVAHICPWDGTTPVVTWRGDDG